MSESRTVAGEPVCHGPQKLVTGAVTQSVVHLLEVVEVDEEHRYAQPFAMSPTEELACLLVTSERLGSPVSESCRAWWRSSAVRSSTSSSAERRERTSRLNKPANKSVTANVAKNTASACMLGGPPVPGGSSATSIAHPGSAGKVSRFDGRPKLWLPGMSQHRRSRPEWRVGQSQRDAALVCQCGTENLVGVEDAQGPTLRALARALPVAGPGPRCRQG